MGSKCTHIFIILAAVQSKIYVLSDREYKLSKDMDQREAMKTVTYHETAANHRMLHFNLSNKKTYVDSFRKSWTYEDAGERKGTAENGSSNAIVLGTVHGRRIPLQLAPGEPVTGVHGAVLRSSVPAGVRGSPGLTAEGPPQREYPLGGSCGAHVWIPTMTPNLSRKTVEDLRNVDREIA